MVLHAHLPYVRHPEYDSFFEESWLFEAMTECYIPLINMLDRLLADKVDYRLTLSLSPTLILMLQDELLQSRYQQYLDSRIELAEKEIIRTKNQTKYQKLARLYRRYFLHAKKTYQFYQGDLLNAFSKHHKTGCLALMTTAATHGFLPLLNVNETAVRNQIKVGINTFKDAFGFSPSGFWLPECGYYPNLEGILSDANIDYFFVESHGISHASQQPINHIYAPLDCGNGVFSFARDPESSQQVWSTQTGYPGDENYREYYSDIGFELDIDIIKPYILDEKIRVNTGIKYHCVTEHGADKDIYNPRQAKDKAQEDAVDFIAKRQQQINRLAGRMDRKPIIVSPYDAELFGHWWAEGPLWLETVIRLAADSAEITLTSCEDYLIEQQDHQQAVPSASTWGAGGYSDYWINEKNEWIYPILHQMADDMVQLAVDFSRVKVKPIQERTLNQACRTLLLAQASDWPFILKSGTTIKYAEKKLNDYFARFNYLHECIRNNKIDERYLLALETMDNVFPTMNYRDYSPL